MDDFVDLINFLLKIEEFRNIVEKKQSFNQFRVNDVVEILDVLNVFEDPIVENALNYVVKKFPESSEIILFYTNYQIQNKRIKKAKQALKFLKSSELENPLFYILTISVHLLESNFNKARRAFEEGLRYASDQDKKWYLRNCGKEFTKYSETLEFGIDILERARSLAPTSTKILFSLVKAYAKNNQINEAYKCNIELLDIDPFFDSAWEEQSNLCTQLGKIEDSIEALYFAWAIYPYRISIHYTLAEQLYRFNRYKEIVLFLENSEIDAKNSSKKHSILGDSYFQLNNLQRALNNASKALKIDAGNSSAWLLKAKISFINRKPETALDQVKQALKNDQNNPIAWFYLSLLQAEKGQKRFAKLSLKQAISHSFEQFDSFPKGHSWLADLEFIFKRFPKKQALKIYSHIRTFLHFSKSENSDKAFLFFYIALVHQKANREKLAEKYFNLFLSTMKNSHYPDPNSILSECLYLHPEIFKKPRKNR